MSVRPAALPAPGGATPHGVILAGAALLLLLTALRLGIAAATPLAPDEAYYWVWSQALAGGYYDHPPMVALWIRAGTWLAGDTALGVRLLGPLAAALGSVLLWQAAEDLLPGRRAGPWAAALANATLTFGAGAVTMTPDTPLLLFWTASIWALARLVATGHGAWWLVAGLAAGLALDSKYTAALLAPAVLVWLLAVPSLRPWLRRPQPWIAAALAALLFAPVLAWNATHDWVSFAKQGGRVGDFQPARALQFLGELIGGQIGLATPLIAVLFGAGLVLALRRAVGRDPGWTLLAALLGVPTLVFLQHALGDRVQANWPLLLHPPAAIAAAGLSGSWLRWRWPALACGAVITAVVWVQAAWAPLALPRRADMTLIRLGGWDRLAADVTAAARAGGAAYVVADNYGQAALLAWLMPRDIPVLAVESRWRWFALPDGTALAEDRPGLLVRSARRAEALETTTFTPTGPAALVERARGGVVAEGFRLYPVRGRAGEEPVVILPRPDR
ncbi:Glycosyltransferase family 39 protein [Rhodovastum atsumiense]|uniref:Glycosyltransferase family 39 protein n=1 Tax=Rhodovastum atsumiense TaxID=504468 RepID=A0A5M6IKD2_9PROT|nr:glycosyltransferase family 39 protein [Rhodovastum atsumiense]KAA5608713.1 glycosyltransferase family 39 protein [Rhodovastum atsumiense]CAH2604976.1 Glycosyltransferase family 39 protein [Rhodovastum atsumiense]